MWYRDSKTDKWTHTHAHKLLSPIKNSHRFMMTEQSSVDRTETATQRSSDTGVRASLRDEQQPEMSTLGLFPFPRWPHSYPWLIIKASGHTHTHTQTFLHIPLHTFMIFQPYTFVLPQWGEEFSYTAGGSVDVPFCTGWSQWAVCNQVNIEAQQLRDGGHSQRKKIKKKDYNIIIQILEIYGVVVAERPTVCPINTVFLLLTDFVQNFPFNSLK